jgi:hypothetical protein
MVDGGIAVHGALDVMDAVAIVAGRRDDQAHLEERAAMDAFHVLRGGVGMGDFIFFGKVGIVMTPGAGLGQVQFEHRRRGVADGEDVVRAVAIPAVGRAGGAEQVTETMDTGGILLRLFLVAMRTIGRRQTGIVNQFLHAGVAIGATEFGVNGQKKTVRGENGERDVFAIDHACGGGVGVAIETVGIGQFIVGTGESETGVKAN